MRAECSASPAGVSCKHLLSQAYTAPFIQPVSVQVEEYHTLCQQADIFCPPTMVCPWSLPCILVHCAASVEVQRRSSSTAR